MASSYDYVQGCRYRVPDSSQTVMGWGISGIFYHDFSSTLRHHFECLAKPCSAGEQQVAFFHYKGGRIFMEHI